MVAIVLSACYNKVFLGAVLLKATLKYSNREKHLADLFLPNLSDEVKCLLIPARTFTETVSLTAVLEGSFSFLS